MIYVQRLPTIDAYQVWTTEQAVTLTGYAPATPYDGEDWAVEWDVDGVTCRLGGPAGAFMWLSDGYWNRADVTTFEAQWEPSVTEALRTTNLRESDLRG